MLSSAQPVVATAASTAGFRSMRLHGITDPTPRRLSREGRCKALRAWICAPAMANAQQLVPFFYVSGDKLAGGCIGPL